MRTGTTRASNMSYTIDNLIHNCQYHFRVFAENSIGLSLPLDTEVAVVAKPPYSKSYFFMSTLSIFDSNLRRAK